MTTSELNHRLAMALSVRTFHSSQEARSHAAVIKDWNVLGVLPT